jgi:hypothetical protein
VGSCGVNGVVERGGSSKTRRGMGAVELWSCGAWQGSFRDVKRQGRNSRAKWGCRLNIELQSCEAVGALWASV